MQTKLIQPQKLATYALAHLKSIISKTHRVIEIQTRDSTETYASLTHRI